MNDPLKPPTPPKRRISEWPRNVQLFLLFRVFFNARYYYPVYALLFLDLGVSLQQFAGLNALWAAAIVALEVPSGALADVLGRRTLLRIASGLMVVEMLALLIPRFSPDSLLWSLALNRVCSGAAEAMASGADEALAYESLPPGETSLWAEVLEVQMRWMNAAMFVTMLVGAAVYEPKLWSRFLALPKAEVIAHTAPVVLTLLHALIVVFAVFSMEETRAPGAAEGWKSTVKAAFLQTRETVLWVVRHPNVRLVIVAAVFFDHLFRQGLVVSSDFLTAIAIPKIYLGVLGAVSALTSSFFATPLARLAQRCTPITMFWLLYASLLAVSAALSHPVKYWSALAVVALSVLAGAVGYLTSLYLNQLSDPNRRATLLSVKGLAMNLGFGWISLAYAAWVATVTPGDNKPPVVSAFEAYIPYALALLPLILLVAWAGRRRDTPGTAGGFSAPADRTCTAVRS